MQIGILIIFGLILLGKRSFSLKSCNPRPITSSTRNNLKLSYFYQKSINVNGILILGSNKVSVSSMRKACYIFHFILAETELQAELSKKNVRVIIMASNEYLSNIPELNNRYGLVNIQSTRSFTAKIDIPIVAIGEELILMCNGQNDNKAKLLGEPFIYNIMYSILSLNAINQSIHNELMHSYKNAKTINLWTISHDHRDYFANGVEVYFNTKIVSPSDSINIQSELDLKNYDIELYNFLKKLFYCNNTFSTLCQAVKDDSVLQSLKIGKNCEQYYGNIKTMSNSATSYIATTITNLHIISTTSKQEVASFTKKVDLDVDVKKANKATDCHDSNLNCDVWFKKGECQRNPQFMNFECRKSCNICSKETRIEPVLKILTKINEIDSSIYEGYCKDDFSYCLSFSMRGDCKTNPHHMLEKCKRSCNLCGDLKQKEKASMNSNKSYNSFGKNYTTVSKKLVTNHINIRTNDADSKNVITSTKISKSLNVTTRRKNTTKRILTNLSKNTTVKPCEDIIDYCVELTQRENCLSNDAMKIYCLKSCKFC